MSGAQCKVEYKLFKKVNCRAGKPGGCKGGKPAVGQVILVYSYISN